MDFLLATKAWVRDAPPLTKSKVIIGGLHTKLTCTPKVYPNKLTVLHNINPFATEGNYMKLLYTGILGHADLFIIIKGALSFPYAPCMEYLPTLIINL